MEKELDKAIEVFLKWIFSIVSRSLKGITKLRSVPRIVGFLISTAVPWFTYQHKEVLFKKMEILEMPVWFKYPVYFLLLIVPLIYLFFMESADQRGQKEYYKIFEEIGFRQKNKKFPYFLKKTEKDGKLTYLFKSTIPLKTWKDAQNRLETGLDCTITLISNQGSKKIIKIETVSSDRKIPDMVKWDDKFICEKDEVLRVGESALNTVEFDLNRTPHILMAGETGSGKSVILRTCLWQGIAKGWKIYMIDFKGGVEFGKRYEQFGEVITERDRALEVLTTLCEENEKRLKLFRDLEVKNLPEYNRKTKSNLCRIGVFCDEIAEMLDKKGVSKEDKPLFEAIEGKLSTLARLSRATGINLFLGVQRPDSNVLTGQIKNNVPVRISGRFADKSASEIVLGTTDAVNLPDIKGRFLFKLGNELIQFQAYYFDDDTMLHDIDIEVGDLLIEQKKDTLQNSYYDPDQLPPLREEDQNTISLDLDF